MNKHEELKQKILKLVPRRKYSKGEVIYYPPDDQRDTVDAIEDVIELIKAAAVEAVEDNISNGKTFSTGSIIKAINDL